MDKTWGQRHLQTAGVSVDAYDVPLRHRPHLPFAALSTGLPEAESAIIHVNPSEMLSHGYGISIIDRSKTRALAYWHWELPVFPPAWAAAIDLVDEIWVPTPFGAQMFLDVTAKPVRIVPHPVPLSEISVEEGRAAFDIPLDRFVCLTVFDTESYPGRKNPAGAIDAFVDAFPTQRDSSPMLVIKMHGSSNRSAHFQELIAKAQAMRTVRIIDGTLDDLSMRRLQAACDCFVSLHRSEGFGFNIAECMGAGRLVIATNFSGNSSFMTPQNSIPIAYKMRAVRPADYVMGIGQWWAEPEHEAAVEAMRWAVAHPAEAHRLALNGKEHMKHFHSF